MPDFLLPTPGDLIDVPGYGEPREVLRVLLTVESDDETRYLVESKHGALWSVRRLGDRWVGAPLPADPAAARTLGGFPDQDLG